MTQLMTLLVALGGALGGLLRWWAGTAVPDGSGFAWTTFIVNVSGAFLLALLPLLVGAAPLSRRWRRRLAALLGPGLLGGFTTFSAYSETTRELLAEGRLATASAYAVATLVAGVVAVLLARLVVRSLAPRLPRLAGPDRRTVA